MAQMPDPRMVDPLTKVLQLDSDNYPFPMFAYACETLGEIGQTKPDAFDEEAASTLVRAVFLTNNKGQNVEMECGLAVQQLGEPAVPHLIEVFKGEHEGVQKLMMAYRRPLNGAKALAVQRLMTLRAESALPALIADLRAEKAAPEEINKTDAAVEWRESEVRALNDTLFAVGEIGGEGAREILVEVLTGERNEDWDDITDAMVELVVRQNAARALKRLGDPEALDAIMEMAAKGVIIPWERRSAMLERRGEPAPPKVRYQFNWMSAKQYAILAPASRIGDYNELLSSTKIEPLKKLFGRFIPALELAKVCDTKGSPAEQAKCYGDSLEDKDVVVRERAAFSLGRLPAEAAGPILVEHLGTERIDTREFIELAIYETAPKSAIAKIDELLENEQDAVDNVYKRDHRRLRLLRAWLKNNAE
jgi:HEAT repeat protein